MPEQKEASTIITPPHVFDFNLLATIFPDAVVVGERLMRLGTVEEVSYQEIGEEGSDMALAVSHTSGCVYFFSDDEEGELEAQIKAVIKRGSAMAQLQARVQELEQELARRIMAESKIVMPGRTGSFRKQ